MAATALLLAGGVLAQGTPAAPRYALQPCCQLCPRAAQPQAYDGSSYLGDFRVLLQGREGWLFRSQIDLATRFELSEASRAGMRRLIAALAQRGTQLVLLPQPPRALMDPDKLSATQRRDYDLVTARRNYAAMLDALRGLGATVPPLDQLIDEHKGYEYFFRRDHHWTPAGAEATAKLVAQTVRQMPAFAGIDGQKFRTQAAALIGKPGTLQKVAAQICGGVYSLQYVEGYLTEAEGGGSGSLLGDDAGSVPQIALIGTSNSDAKGGYNFAGYLRQYLSADVLNAALTGGSFDGALLQYLPSEAFQKHPPKILIWEFPWQNWPAPEKNPYRSFRQALPLVDNGCARRAAVYSRELQVHGGDNELIFNGGRVQPWRGDRYWLDLRFDDPAIKDLHAIIWYYDGQKESLKLHFTQYVDNGGRFVTELRRDRADYAQATLMGATLSLDAAPARATKVTVRLCANQQEATP